MPYWSSLSVLAQARPLSTLPPQDDLTYSQNSRMANDCTVPEYSGATVAIAGLTFSCIVSDPGFIGYYGDRRLAVVSRKRLIEVSVHVFKSITETPIPSSFQPLTSSSPPPTLIHQISLSFLGRTCSGPSLCVLHPTAVHHLATADPPPLPRILVLSSLPFFLYSGASTHTLFRSFEHVDLIRRHIFAAFVTHFIASLSQARSFHTNYSVNRYKTSHSNNRYKTNTLSIITKPTIYIHYSLKKCVVRI